MTGALPYLVGAALAATLTALFAGIVVMARGGELNRKYGNTLMRTRIVLQGLAVVLFILLMLTSR
ncbi:MAG: twin transmembrane helix small protein [Alphaproteobacteria bacterium]|nr:twin transmembrane helix small protein [Alphaproteobacteria bacterium]